MYVTQSFIYISKFLFFFFALYDSYATEMTKSFHLQQTIQVSEETTQLCGQQVGQLSEDRALFVMFSVVFPVPTSEFDTTIHQQRANKWMASTIFIIDLCHILCTWLNSFTKWAAEIFAFVSRAEGRHC